MDKAIERLLEEPALAWKVSANILGQEPASPDVGCARESVREGEAGAGLNCDL
jgi:hypothetical protein